jgi:hypothetical protein
LVLLKQVQKELSFSEKGRSQTQVDNLFWKRRKRQSLIAHNLSSDLQVA